MEPGVQSKFRMTERRNVIYRKYLQSVFCIALVLTVLTGCGKNTGQTSRSTEKKEIDIPIILTVDPTSGKKTEQDVVDAFNEEYAGTYHMQVEWIMETEEEYRKNLKRLNVTDELPAVIYDVRTLPSFYQMMVADGRIENLSPYLEEDETTVGTKLDIHHTAATPEGLVATASAEIVGVCGREISFHITVSDTAGEIGTGTHQRFLVDAARFMEKARRRKSQPQA